MTDVTAAPIIKEIKPGSEPQRINGRFSAFEGLARHTGGFYIEDRQQPMTVEAAMNAAGLNFEVAVTEDPVASPVVWAGGVTNVTHPNKFLTYGQYGDGEPFPLGVVGKVFEPYQNRQAFSFGQRLVNDHGANVVAAGTWGDPRGSRCYIAFRMPETYYLGEDAIEIYAHVVNGHDGGTGLNASVGPIQLACVNQIPSLFAKGRGGIKFRHTRSIHQRTDAAAAVLGLGLRWWQTFRPIGEELLATPMSDADFVSFMTALWGELDVEATERTRNYQERRRDELQRLWHHGTNPVGRGTRYGALNAVTEFADWSQRYNGGDTGRFSRLADGAAEPIKVKALDLLVSA